MNATKFFAAAALVLSSSAFAQTAEGNTRAQVSAELQAAQAAGLLSSGGEAYQNSIDFESAKTRAEVKAETIAAQNAGLIVSGDQYGAILTVIAAPSGKTRAEVQAEFIQARELGLVRHED